MEKVKRVAGKAKNTENSYIDLRGWIQSPTPQGDRVNGRGIVQNFHSSLLILEACFLCLSFPLLLTVTHLVSIPPIVLFYSPEV